MTAPDTGPDAGEAGVWAVVVTRHRAELLADGLAVLAKQTRRPDHLVVVDNGPDQATCLLYTSDAADE